MTPEDTDAPATSKESTLEEVEATSVSDRPLFEFTWLTVSVCLSSLLLLLNYLGVHTPSWLIYVLNPVAWVSNITGITNLRPGFLLAFDGAIGGIGGFVGLPILGSLGVWLLLSGASFRFRVLHFVCIVLPGFVALQFTMQRAYLALAEKAVVKADAEDEAFALSCALDISSSMGNPGAMREGSVVLRVTTRLAHLQDQLGERVATPEISTIRIGKTTVSIATEHLPLEIPKLAKNHNGFRAFKETLSEVYPDFDVDELGSLSIGDIRFHVGIAVASSLAIVFNAVPTIVSDPTPRMLEAELHLTVHVHPSETDLERQVQTTPHTFRALNGGTSRIVAFYDRSSDSLHLCLPDAAYRKEMMEGLELVADGEWRFSKHGVPLSLTARKLHGPLIHELWHFVADNSGTLGRLPAVLEEGLALWYQFLEESINETMAQNAQLFDGVGAPGNWRDPEREQKLLQRMVQTSSTQRRYCERVIDAYEGGKLVSVDTLLSLSSAALHRRPDTALLYAEGWVLFSDFWFRPKALEKLLADAAPADSAENKPVWPMLDEALVSTARALLEGRNPYGPRFFESKEHGFRLIYDSDWFSITLGARSHFGGNPVGARPDLYLVHRADETTFSVVVAPKPYYLEMDVETIGAFEYSILSYPNARKIDGGYMAIAGEKAYYVDYEVRAADQHKLFRSAVLMRGHKTYIISSSRPYEPAGFAQLRDRMQSILETLEFRTRITAPRSLP